MPRRILALLAVLVLLCVQVLTGAGAADALPRGAYWYSLLDLPKTWKITEGSGVTVGVVDAGVEASDGDLRGQVLRGLDLTGKDPGAQREEASSDGAGFGHGTDMAALIAGTGRGAGLTGVAPEAKILPVDASTDGKFTDSDIARGITWTADHGAKVISVSLGGPGTCSTVLRQAMEHAYQRDVIVVVSAGDDGGAVYTPANCPGALAISAVDSEVNPWAKTARGPEVAFGAPGYDLVNELLTNRLNGPNPANSGTSQAAAIAAGTFALLRAHFPEDTARQIVTRALYNVHNGLGAGRQGDRAGDALGYGMVLPHFALTEAPPANAKNPIYDRWARDFGTPSGSPSTSPASTGTTSAPSSTAGTPAVSGPSASASGGGGGGISPVLVVVIVVVVLAVIVAVVVVARRRSGPRGPRGPTGFPPAPPGYGR